MYSGSISQNNIEVGVLSTTPQPVLLEVTRQNGTEELTVKQSMKDKDDNIFEAQFIIPPFTPAGVNIPMTRRPEPWIKSFEGSTTILGTPENGFSFMFIGLEGTIAKMLAPIAIEIDQINIIAETMNKAVDLSIDVRKLADRQLYALASNLTGLSLLGWEDKRMVIRALNYKTEPNAENIKKIVELFIGSTDPNLISVSDIEPMVWGVRMPKPLSGDALWGYDEKDNYQWLLERIKPIATNVLGIIWYYSVVETETWSPTSFVKLLERFVAMGYNWHSYWDADYSDPDYNPLWGTGGVWDAPSDRVYLQ